MTDTRWLDVIARLPAEDPIDIDPILGTPTHPRSSQPASGPGTRRSPTSASA